MTSTVYHSTVSVLPFNWTPQKWVKPRFNPCAPQTRLNTHHKVCSKLTTLGEMFMTLITLSHATRFKDLAFSRILSRESLSSKVYSWGDKCNGGSEGELCERLGAEVNGLYDKYDVSACQFMGNMMYGLPHVVPTYPGASTPINALSTTPKDLFHVPLHGTFYCSTRHFFSTSTTFSHTREWWQ